MSSQRLSSRRLELNKICDDMHSEVAAVLVVAADVRMTPAILQRLRDIYDDALRRAALVGELHSGDRSDDDVWIDPERSTRATLPGVAAEELRAITETVPGRKRWKLPKM